MDLSQQIKNANATAELSKPRKPFNSEDKSIRDHMQVGCHPPLAGLRGVARAFCGCRVCHESGFFVLSSGTGRESGESRRQAPGVPVECGRCRPPPLPKCPLAAPRSQALQQLSDGKPVPYGSTLRIVTHDGSRAPLQPAQKVRP